MTIINLGFNSDTHGFGADITSNVYGRLNKSAIGKNVNFILVLTY